MLLLRAACKPQDELTLENLALQQQVTALKLGRLDPKLHDADRAFWAPLPKSRSNPVSAPESGQEANSVATYRATGPCLDGFEDALALHEKPLDVRLHPDHNLVGI